MKTLVRFFDNDEATTNFEFYVSHYSNAGNIPNIGDIVRIDETETEGVVIYKYFWYCNDHNEKPLCMLDIFIDKHHQKLAKFYEDRERLEDAED